MPPSQQLLRYRPWKGEFSGPARGVIAIARVGLGLLFRRKLFWAMYGLSLMIFLFFFYGQYLQVFLEQRVSAETVQVGGLIPSSFRPEMMMKRLRDVLQLNGSADTYANFIWFEGYIVMIILALVGSVLVGNDFQHGSLPFYLSKPIHRWHYVLGKCLAVAVFVNLMTTLPAVILFFEFGFIDEWEYYWTQSRLLLGILVYGAVLTVTLSLLLMATATWVRRTVPMVMVWTTLFVLGRILQRWLVDGLKLSPSWRLVDLWNDMYLVGQWALGTPLEAIRPTSQIQPPYWQAALAIGIVWVGSLLYLRNRIQAVEVVS
jgi:ABC-type transport system involved in multi-copper enzyme maturation permease subunit